MKPFPDAALQQHLAILGKTGAGKSITAKLAVEQAVAAGARVCVLDPIKSDWWGLTSSADGKKPGLPFRILGGPRGHVPLHDAAGKAVAEVVASGSLPLSIIDMADFKPGGQARFFVDFAPALLRKMRGVLYLVLEEAHLFAPKERSGIGEENMAIHWAKMIATAGRSKGVRLILLTQRTQSLHNALLGSCDSVVAHRLTAPADQKPVLDWLKANTDAETTAAVAASLSSLKTGEGWLCCGEARVFERRAFPMIRTYDNTRTPTGEDGEHHVKTAPVDADQLKALIGDAVKEAEADDPKLLRKRIAELERQLRDRPTAPVEVVKTVEVPVLANGQLERMEKAAERFTDAHERFSAVLVDLKTTVARAVQKPAPAGRVLHPATKTLPPAPKPPGNPAISGGRVPRSEPATSPAPADGTVSPRQQRFLDAAAALTTLNTEVTRETVAAWVGVHPRGGSVGEELKALADAGLIVVDRGRITVTDAGMAAAGQIDPATAIDRAKEGLSDRQRRFFEVIVEAYPGETTREEIAARFELHPRGGSLGEDLGRLVGRGLVEGGRGQYRARDFLFAGSR